jgi:hypothetical protein
MPAAFLLVGLALARLRPTPRAGFMVALALLCGLGLSRLYEQPARMREPFPSVGKRLALEASAEDLVVARSIPSGVAGLARAMETERSLASPPRFLAWVDQLGQRQLPDDLLRAAAGRRRLFYVDIHAVSGPSLAQEWLEQHTELREARWVEGARMLQFVPRDGAASF